MFFSQILDPRYLQLTNVLNLQVLEGFDNKEYFTTMMGVLLEYMCAHEEKQNPTPNNHVTTRSTYALPDLLTFDDSMHDPNFLVESLKVCYFVVKVYHFSKLLTIFLKSRAKREFEIYKNTVKSFFGSGKKIESAQEVFDWYEPEKLRIPMVYNFAYNIFCIPASQIENEKDFSLAGVIQRSRRTSFTVKHLLCWYKLIKVKI